MTAVRCFALLFLISLLAHSQVTSEHPQVDLSSQAEMPVRRLYQQLMSRPIGGIPTPQRMKLISPYLSSGLLRRIAEARACGRDYFRLHPERNVKPPLAWGEFGLFSGADDRSGPQMFQIEKTESDNDGTFRVYLRLAEGDSPEKRWMWHVAAVVVSGNKHFAINDVIFLRDMDADNETRLSEILTSGCDGPRWVGYPNR